ncbi:hypothetical protein HY639_00020 [Candidatus Woesearchaeota archaeon]|nr:hypothetical protein [Candidatus Woesearchaeota archaeon]
MENAEYTQLEKRLQEYSYKTEEQARGLFEYPESVQLYKSAHITDYTRVGITDSADIGRLIDSDILPPVTVGSRSQGEHEYCSPFNLEKYVQCGVTRPDEMIKLRNANVTPYALHDLLTDLKSKGITYSISDVVDEIVKIGGESTKKSARTDLSLCHEFNYGAMGKQLQKWLEKK